jgi:signal transduction histidine kinase
VEGTLAAGEVLDEPRFLLETLIPTPGQRRVTLAIAAILLVTLGVMIPLAATKLPEIGAFIPTIQGIFFVNDLITALLLFSQCSISCSRALRVLANGYLFAGLMALLFSLTFPGAFAPAGLFGAGLQSAGWIYGFQHYGFAATVLGYTWLKDDDPAKKIAAGSTQYTSGWSMAIVIGLVLGLGWLATAEDILPELFVDKIHYTSGVFYAGGMNILLCVAAIALLWIRRHSLLDLILMIVMVAMIAELALVGLFAHARFDLGFYAGRIFMLITSSVVLVVLIAQTTKSDARLARSNMMLQRERDNKLMNLAAVAASISHQVRQPLAAIIMDGAAALRFLGQSPPNLAEVRFSLDSIQNDCHRAGQVFDRISTLFEGGDQNREQVDMNEVALGVLRTLRSDLKEHGIATHTDLQTGLPSVIGYRSQLREVILNLVNIAIEAKDKESNQVLRIKTANSGMSEIAVTVEDSETGIDPENSASHFDGLVRTTPQEMGLSLAVCHVIIQHHGGHISARTRGDAKGTLFRFTLPIGSTAGL